jgi:uncharacterized protein GlcG (DUF336 family)
MNVTQDEAQALIDAAQERATETDRAMSIAVVDSGGYIVAIRRMDRARPLTPSIALAKAYSAAIMQRPTHMLKDWSSSDPVFFSQVARMGHQPIVATLGGYTLKRDGEIVGGVGISGGSPQEDQDVCEAIVSAAGYEMTFQAWAGAAGRPQ